jgi:hypothetical protein
MLHNDTVLVCKMDGRLDGLDGLDGDLGSSAVRVCCVVGSSGSTPLS